jgi:hypothetical protein
MRKISLVLVAAIAAVSMSSVFAAAADEFVTPAQITAAKSPADHEAIAKAYDAEADAYDKKIDWHKSMAGAYANGKGPQKQEVVRCQQLEAKFKSIAQEYRAMAASHRLMAKNAK